MKYIGSKSRHAKYILPIILKDRKENQTYVEPFCGGCNTIDKVSNPRIANDSHSYLIAMWQALQNGWVPPENLSESQYKNIQKNKNQYPDELVGYVGFNLSYAARWWGGYGRDKIGKRNYGTEAFRNVSRQVSLIQGIDFRCQDYLELEIPSQSLVYCDPPYRGSDDIYRKSLTGEFDSETFWLWAEKLASNGHTVFVSEYSAPNGWKSVWRRKVNNTLVQNTGSKQGTENLFVFER